MDLENEKTVTDAAGREVKAGDAVQAIDGRKYVVAYINQHEQVVVDNRKAFHASKVWKQ